MFWKEGNRIFSYWKWCFSWWCGINGAANTTTFVCKTAHFTPQTQRFCIVISHKKRRKQGAKWAFPPVFHVPFWLLFYNRLAISVISTHTIFGVFPSKIFWNENTPIGIYIHSQPREMRVLEGCHDAHTRCTLPRHPFASADHCDAFSGIHHRLCALSGFCFCRR